MYYPDKYPMNWLCGYTTHDYNNIIHNIIITNACPQHKVNMKVMTIHVTLPVDIAMK